MRILYVGHDYGTSKLRSAALCRIGCEVHCINPYFFLPIQWNRWLRWFGGPGIDLYVANKLSRLIPNSKYDFAHVDSGEIIGPKSLSVIRRYADKIYHFTLDNPYCIPQQEKHRWAIFRKAAAHYDLCVTVFRPGIENSIEKYGVSRYLTVWQSADESIHRPPVFDSLEIEKWSSDVIFIGTWMPGRDTFIKKLVDYGVNIKIYGDRWEKAPEYRFLAQYISNNAVYDSDYTNAIAGAKIALVLLNDANQDLHTTRSAEIPAIGTLMCAPRTEHHLILFDEDIEAVFFNDPEECAQKCKLLLADETRRKAIASAGHARVKRNGMYNEVLMRLILSKIQVCKTT